ncbi:MAG: protein translocase subunit SecF [Desulfurispora sp.]|uniref:protein translocase subunit SecF n=1 Tax=Desulfurispora sp. TaxID=3014275 RepID=UPI00404A1A79
MFHFIKLRKYWYILSLVIIIPGLFSLMVRGLNLGIDFTGGNILEVRFAQQVTIDRVRQVVENLDLGSGRNVQQSGERDFIIRTRPLSQEESNKLLDALQKNEGQVTLLRSAHVGPVIGKELTRNALLALLIASVLMVVYITLRFEFKQGIAAIIALLHDVLVTTGLFSIFQFEVDSAFVAALLTIIGYSINDTIIIFDRIRENMRVHRRVEELGELINVSLWQTLSRSINTVLTVLFVLLALYFLGGTPIKNFVLAMLIGVSSGAYSSIFNASPVWYDLKMMEKKKSLRTA